MNHLFNKKVIGTLIIIMLFSFISVALMSFFKGDLFWDWKNGRLIGIQNDKEEYDAVIRTNRKTFRESASLKAKEKIIIDSDFSEINIRKSSSNEMEVVYDAYQSSIFHVRESGSNLIIEAKIDSKTKYPKNVRLTIDCPEQYVKNMEIVSNMGSISLKGQYKTVDIKTNMGSIEIDGKIEQLNLTSDLGSIDAKGTILSADVESCMGSIEFKTNQMKGGRYNLTTNMGSIDFAIPEDADVNVEARTNAGEIACSGDFNNIKKSGELGNKLTAINKSGKAKVNLSADAGSITIKKKGFGKSI